MQALASTPEEDFNGAVQCTQYQLDDEMEEEDMQDTQNGPQLILVGTLGERRPPSRHGPRIVRPPPTLSRYTGDMESSSFRTPWKSSGGRYKSSRR